MAKPQQRGNSWRIQVRYKGYNLSETFKSKTAAQEWERKVKTDIDRGVYQNTSVAQTMTLKKLIERYREVELPNLESKSSVASILDRISEFAGHVMLSKITSEEIIKYRNHRLTCIQQNSADREVATYKRLLSFAHDDCQIKLPDGIPRVKQLNYDDQRDRRVLDAEIAAICAHTQSKELANIVKLAVYTGLRSSEIKKLEWKNFDLSIPSVRIIRPKNKKTSDRPLSPAAVTLIKSLPKTGTGKLFSLKGIRQSFERARERARKAYELECITDGTEPDVNFLLDLRFHDLRHEAITRTSKKLSNIIELSKFSGHKELRMLARYYHPDTREMAQKLAT